MNETTHPSSGYVTGTRVHVDIKATALQAN